MTCVSSSGDYSVHIPLMELGSVFMVSSVNLAAKSIFAPSMASLRAMTGAFPPKALLAPGIVAAIWVMAENSLAFCIYRLKVFKPKQNNCCPHDL